MVVSDICIKIGSNSTVDFRISTNFKTAEPSVSLLCSYNYMDSARCQILNKGPTNQSVEFGVIYILSRIYIELRGKYTFFLPRRTHLSLTAWRIWPACGT